MEKQGKEMIEQGYLFPPLPHEKNIGFDKKNQVLEHAVLQLTLGVPQVKALHEQAFEAYLIGQETGVHVPLDSSIIDIFHTENTANDCLSYYQTIQGVVKEAGISFEEGPMIPSGRSNIGEIAINFTLGTRAKFITTVHEYAHHLLGHVGNEENQPDQRRQSEIQASTVAFLVGYYFGIFSFSTLGELGEMDLTSNEIEKNIVPVMEIARNIVDTLEQKGMTATGVKYFVLPESERVLYDQDRLF